MSFKDKLKGLEGRKEIPVDVGDDVIFTLREMNGNMRDYWDADNQKRVKFKGRNPDLNTLRTEGSRALIVAMTLVDDDTKELAFDYKDAEQLKELGKLASGKMEKLVDAAYELCGIRAEDAKDAEKN